MAEFIVSAGARCARCGWPLAGDQSGGCIEGNCSCRCGEYPVCRCGRTDGKSLSCPPDPRDADLARLRAEVARQAKEIEELREALANIDDEILDAVADEITEFKHSARMGSVRIIAKQIRAARALEPKP